MADWFITGASRGLGLAIAQAALETGEQVTATGRDPEAVRRVIGSDDDRLTCLALDVRERAQVSEAVARAEAAMGSIAGDGSVHPRRTIPEREPPPAPNSPPVRAQHD